MTDHEAVIVREIGVPERGLVILVGISGSGKSTFAARHFLPTQVVSSDICRAIVSDDEFNQAATPDAFALLEFIVATRLRRGLLTVVDATNVQKADRAKLIQVARNNDALVDAIVLEVPEAVAEARLTARNAGRPADAQVIRRQSRDLARSRKSIRKEGFRRVHFLEPAPVHSLEPAAVIAGLTRNLDCDWPAIRFIPQKPWNDRTDLTGPFDIIGDVHGCSDELLELLTRLGWEFSYDDDDDAVGSRLFTGLPTSATHPDGRIAVFLGDLVDRGPNTPEVLRLVMNMVASGNALCVQGNHEARLARALQGRKVERTHGLAESLAQLAETSPDFTERVERFADSLISHYVLDGGKLVVAHAGLPEKLQGRQSARVRAFALYGDTTGEIDQYGLPVRFPWAQDYRGKALVVYGHTPTTVLEWVNNTLCIDTGCVFGGELTALRYPEKETVGVPAERQYATPGRPLATAESVRDPGVLKVTDVIGDRWLSTKWGGKVKITAENAAAALEVMSRFAVDPRWLIYLPPTMAPAPSATEPDYLEYPTSAFSAFAKMGVAEVVCEEKHMGSRAVAVLARDSEAAKRRFGVTDGSTGVVVTRTGRPFLPDLEPLVSRLTSAVTPLFDSLETDWLALDCEILPWSLKALPLIQEQYAAVGAAASSSLEATERVLAQAAARGLDVAALQGRIAHRAENVELYSQAFARYVSPINGLDGVQVAPFQILAGEGHVYATERDHRWQLEQISLLTDPFIRQTKHVFVTLDDDGGSPAEITAATDWWLDLTAQGGEGMVVKPVVPEPRKQPGLKVRGLEYLRIIYGPDYLDRLSELRERSVARKRTLALREYGLGIEALHQLVTGRPLWEIHQNVFGVLALESEPVDPRL